MIILQRASQLRLCHVLLHLHPPPSCHHHEPPRRNPTPHCHKHTPLPSTKSPPNLPPSSFATAAGNQWTPSCHRHTPSATAGSPGRWLGLRRRWWLFHNLLEPPRTSPWPPQHTMWAAPHSRSTYASYEPPQASDITACHRASIIKSHDIT